MSEDLSHDPHLRAALRHAPDHALAPPAGVSQTILNAARHVHKPVRPAASPAPAVRITVAPPRAVAWLRQWFGSPRLAGGLATALVAALGLGLWIDLGHEPLIDRAPIEAAKEVRSSEAVAVTPSSAAAESPAGGSAEARLQSAPVPAPAARPEASRAKRSAAQAQVTHNVDTVQPVPAGEAPAVTRERREHAAVAPRSESEGARSRPPTAAPPAAAPAAPPPTAEPAPAPALADAAAAAQKAATAVPDAQRDAALRSDTRMSLAAGRAAEVAGARAPAADSAGDAASPAMALLRRARNETASGNVRWTWMPPGKAAIVPLDEAARDWLARAVQATRGRWTDTDERFGSGAATEVRWWRNDWPQATLRIEADGLRWIEHNGAIRHAPLDAAALQRLASP